MAEVGGYNPNVQNLPGQNRQVGRSGDIAQTGGVKGSQKVQRAPDKSADTTTQVVQQKIPTIARRMTPRDIVQQLIRLEVRPTAENRAMALKMVMFGLELSKENFQKIENMLKGLSRNSFTEQAAIVLVGKGLASKAAVEQLAAFLQSNPQLSEQLADLLKNSRSLQDILSGQNILSPRMSTQLAAVLGSLEGFLTVLPKELRDKLSKGSGLFSKSELLTNARALRALVSGVSKQAAQAGPEANTLLAGLANLGKQAKNVAENLIVQAILSRVPEREDSAFSENFAYWQIPNSLAKPPQTVELLVERDKKNRNRSINPRKTKLILKTSTEALGEIAVEVEVDEDNVDFKFNTNEEEIRKLINASVEDLKKNLQKYDYKTRSVRVVKRNLDIKKFLLPTLDLNNLTRVQTEV